MRGEQQGNSKKEIEGDLTERKGRAGQTSGYRAT